MIYEHICFAVSETNRWRWLHPVPASWLSGDWEGGWDRGIGGRQGAEGGLKAGGKGVSTVGGNWGFHGATKPELPCGSCSTDTAADTKQEADRGQTEVEGEVSVTSL